MKKKLLLTALLVGLSFTYTLPVHAMTQDELNAWFSNYCEENGLNPDDYSISGGSHPELSISSKVATTQNPIVNSEVQTQTPVVEVVHEHEYTSKVTKESTCTEYGVETFTCDCGDSYTESIEMIEHDYSKETVVKEATCTEVGEKQIICSMCDDFITEEIPVTGHIKGSFEVVTSPTCEENGLEELKCSVCDEVLESKEIPATGHIEGEWEIEKEGTLFHEGSKIQRCTTCGKILYKEIIPINKKGWYMVGGLVIVAVVMVGILLRKQKRINNK